jgi:hypothetical protein
LAHELNSILGGPFLTPWDVRNLPESELLPILSMRKVAEIKDNLQKVDAEFAAWRNNNARK